MTTNIILLYNEIEKEKKQMKIRKAEIKDLSDILRIYAYARAFMKENGNPDQWGNVYPSLEMVREDIEKGICYVCAEEKHIVGVFVFFKGEDPTYRIIREGKWHRNIPYGVLHRVASDGNTKGISKLCFDFAKEHCDYLRIDTHKDNIPMQNTLAKNGFRKCGIIDTYDDTNDGSPRIAYDWEA